MAVVNRLFNCLPSRCPVPNECSRCSRWLDWTSYVYNPCSSGPKGASSPSTRHLRLGLAIGNVVGRGGHLGGPRRGDVPSFFARYISCADAVSIRAAAARPRPGWPSSWGVGRRGPYEEPHARAQGGRCEAVDAGNVRLDGTTGTACHDECGCRDCRAVRAEVGSRPRRRNWFVQVEWSCGGELGGEMACSV